MWTADHLPERPDAYALQPHRRRAARRLAPTSRSTDRGGPDLSSAAAWLVGGHAVAALTGQAYGVDEERLDGQAIGLLVGVIGGLPRGPVVTLPLMSLVRSASG